MLGGFSKARERYISWHAHMLYWQEFLAVSDLLEGLEFTPAAGVGGQLGLEEQKEVGGWRRLVGGEGVGSGVAV